MSHAFGVGVGVFEMKQRESKDTATQGHTHTTAVLLRASPHTPACTGGWSRESAREYCQEGHRKPGTSQTKRKQCYDTVCTHPICARRVPLLFSIMFRDYFLLVSVFFFCVFFGFDLFGRKRKLIIVKL